MRSLSPKNASTRSSAARVGCPSLVDQILRHHRVREPLDPERVAGARVDLDGLEAGAELAAQRVETLARAEGIAREAHPEHRAAALHALLDFFEIAVREVQRRAMRAGDAEGKRGLREDGRHHGFVDHQRQREVPGQAHAERAHAGPAALRVRAPTERAQPLGDRARLAARQHRELAAHADARGLRQHVGDREGLPRRPEQMRQVDPEAGVGDARREARDRRRDARDLVDHHHARAASARVDGARGAARFERERVKALQRHRDLPVRLRGARRLSWHNARPPEEPPIQFNPLDPGLRRDPFPTYARARREAPALLHSGLPVRLVSVFRYEDCQAILRDAQAWSSEFPLIDQMAGQEGPPRRSMLGSDPPAHTRLRSLVTKAFTPRMIQRLEPRMHEIANQLLDAALEQGEVDLVQALTYPLPVTVIAEIIGIPPRTARCSSAGPTRRSRPSGWSSWAATIPSARSASCGSSIRCASTSSRSPRSAGGSRARIC